MRTGGEEMGYLPDNYDMWARNDAEKEEELRKLPRCAECGEPIQTDYCYGNNGKYICEHCLNAYFRHSVEDLM